MKVAILISGLSSGGAEHQAVITAEMLADKGHEVVLITFSNVEDHYSYDIGKIHRERIGVTHGKAMRMLCLLKHIRKSRYDAIITFGRRESCIASIALFLNKKTIILGGERCLTFGTPNIYEKLLFAALYKRINYIVSNSQTQADYIINKKESLRDKVKVIHNYTDVEHFCFIPRQNNNVRKIGVFARYKSQKNGLLFIDAVDIVRKKTASNFRVEWFGNQKEFDGTDNQYYRKMLQKIKDLELEDYIVLNDHVPDVKLVMGNYDAMCLPSISEGFSNSISEAICSGLPILASEVADNPVMVKNKINGYLFNPNNVGQIADAIQNFIEIPYEKIEEFGKHSRDIAEKLFNKEIFINKYIELLTK